MLSSACYQQKPVMVSIVSSQHRCSPALKTPRGSSFRIPLMCEGNSTLAVGLVGYFRGLIWEVKRKIQSGTHPSTCALGLARFSKKKTAQTVLGMTADRWPRGTFSPTKIACAFFLAHPPTFPRGVGLLCPLGQKAPKLNFLAIFPKILAGTEWAT